MCMWTSTKDLSCPCCTSKGPRMTFAFSRVMLSLSSCSADTQPYESGVHQRYLPCGDRNPTAVYGALADWLKGCVLGHQQGQLSRADRCPSMLDSRAAHRRRRWQIQALRV